VNGNKRELLKILKEDRGDIELNHKLSDEALLNYIGDKEITEAFDSLPRWPYKHNRNKRLIPMG
jgi:hypothetical protein